MQQLAGVMFGGSLLALAIAPPARAAAPALTVTSSCPGLNAALVQRLLRLELAPVMSRKPHDLRIQVACQGHRVTVRMVDILTRKTVVRSFAVRHDRPDLERVVALATAQLFVVSWVELLSRPSPRPPPPRATPPTVRPRPGERGWRPTVGVEVCAAARDLLGPDPRPMGAYGTALRLGLELGSRWQLTAAFTFSGGRAVRDSGEVELLLPGMRLGALWRWLRRGRVELATELMLGLQYVRLRGISETGMESAAIHGLVGEAVLGSGPRLLLGRYRLGLQVQVGVTFPAVVGEVVVEGDRDVRPGLLWVGGTVIFEVALW